MQRDSSLGFGFGSALVGMALVFVGFAGEASAGTCKADCNAMFRGCIADANATLADCRTDCADDVPCIIECLNVDYKAARQTCRDERVMCRDACPPVSCVAQCSKDFSGCVRTARQIFANDCRADTCNAPFQAEIAVCRQLPGGRERGLCISDANRKRSACIQDCSQQLGADHAVCRADRDTCRAGCS